MDVFKNILPVATILLFLNACDNYVRPLPAEKDLDYVRIVEPIGVFVWEPFKRWHIYSDDTIFFSTGSEFVDDWREYRIAGVYAAAQAVMVEHGFAEYDFTQPAGTNGLVNYRQIYSKELSCPNPQRAVHWMILSVEAGIRRSVMLEQQLDEPNEGLCLGNADSRAFEAFYADLRELVDADD